MQLADSQVSLYYRDGSCAIPAQEDVDFEAEQLQPVSEGCCIFSSELAVSAPVCRAPLQLEGRNTSNQNKVMLILCKDFRLSHHD